MISYIYSHPYYYHISYNIDVDLIKIGVSLVCYLLLIILVPTNCLANYTPNYTVLDVDDIVIDTMATGMVEVKNDTPEIMALCVTYFIILLLFLIAVGITSIFSLFFQLLPSLLRGKPEWSIIRGKSKGPHH